MRRKLAAACFCLSLWGAAPLNGEEGIKQPVAVTTTQKLDFAPGGVIRMTGDYGYVNLEGWDQPAVEITVTKSLGPDYGPERQERAKQRLERVRVVAERRSDTDLLIATILPPRGGPLPHSKQGGVILDYDIHVPRDTRLVIHHGKGFVSVTGVTADIEATVSSGDILLMLPDLGPRAIDAKCRIGKVDSDFAGTAHRKYLIGERFDRANSTGTRRIHLRVGFGGITIKQLPPESEPPIAAGGP
jgi:hypothetical protein